MLLKIYSKITSKALPLWEKLLTFRLSKGKEDETRVNERRGITDATRPEGKLIWLHAASVGETQSSLILINAIIKKYPDVQFLITSGTVTSANLMAERLPKNAIHQYVPYDRPEWVAAFLSHWRPDFVLWMESELWPNMLQQVKEQKIPAALINARLSPKSFQIWRVFKSTAKEILSTFSLILTQTHTHEKQFKSLGQTNVVTSDNIKYSAVPLPIEGSKLGALKTAIGARPFWVYASTHEGEELLACKIHSSLKQKIPDILTIIIPRHPERRNAIHKICNVMKLHSILRGDASTLPEKNTDIYIADTLGELGMFYSITDIAMIGRSFSDDGGGGHNPIEAAQMKCVVLTGPNVQYQQDLFDDMFRQNAAYQMDDKTELLNTLRNLLGESSLVTEAINTSYAYAQTKTNVINIVMEQLTPHLDIALKQDADHAV